jgi:trimeric autotransporter adhesin
MTKLRTYPVTGCLIVTLCLVVGCGGGNSSVSGGGGSGGGGGTPPPPPSNPVPAIISLNPGSANAGGAAFSLTITGQNFMSSSGVQWNGSSVATTYSSSSQLQAQIPAENIATAGSATVSVTNPAPGGGNSGLAEFTVNASSNPAPSLTILSPSSVNTGTSGFLLTVTGTDFVSTSTIEWNGVPCVTTYLSETQLEAEIPGTSVAVSGSVDVTVVNPTPGGGASQPVTFTIAGSPVAVISQSANDLIWDSTNQVIYLSVPSLGGTYGNTIAVLDPSTGNIVASQFAGSEPDLLATSDDGQYLYAGIDGSASVQRFILPHLVPDINYSLGTSGNLGAYGPSYAIDLQVAPGLAHTTAASRGSFVVSPIAQGGIAVYDDAVQRPTIADNSNVTGIFFDSLQWGSDAVVYAINNEFSFDLSVLAVNSGGITLTTDYPSEFSTYYVKLHYDAGTGDVYTDDGYVIDPANGQHVGQFQASGLMVPDSTLNSAFFLGQTQAQSGTTNFTIESFDLTTLAATAEITVPNVRGNPLHFIRWGANGLAFHDDAGYVYVLNSPFVTADNKRIVTPQRYLNPVVRTQVSRKTIRALSAVANVGSKHRLKSRAYSADSAVPNPVPSMTALNPSMVTAGVGAFTLTVTGSNFVSLSTIQWAGNSLPTEFVSSSELQAQVGASDVATAGTVVINVVTPGPGGGTAPALIFGILPASGTVPVILSLYPGYVVAGSPGFTLNVNGLAYFNASSVVEWNGSPRPSYLYANGQLQVQITASDVSTPGNVQVTVTNAGPGGGTSNVAEFQVLYQPVVVNQVTNDIIWDPLNQVMYISVPSTASSHANQVCVLNPATAAISNCQTGNEPDALAISDDSQFLYVAMDGANSVQRFILPGLTPDIGYSLGTEPGTGTPYYALDLQVAPGAPHTTAVSLGTDTDPHATGGITIFDDSTPRPTSAPGWGPTDDAYDSLQWGLDATVLYAANSENSTMDFYTLGVSPSGVVLTADYPGDFWNPGKIHYDRGSEIVYSDDGFHAIDPSTGMPAGIFEVGGGWPMAPDSSLNTVFILDQYTWQTESPNYTVDLFDMTHYVPVGQMPFVTQANPILEIGRFIRWGSNGLAVNDTQGNIYLISGSFVSANHESLRQAQKTRRQH